ncbi:glycosyltransferase family 92 protein [Klebsiella variicola]|uniref:glycosyltransferase family 92 protein n=1 Tax=Klebsiella variicola TaxID=244366 RepID=UPI000765FC43|nr:glycosyltransferase family 92 protein [Klebsiella variicola]HBZ7349658.1 glycosyltransferase family 92 protein [Klebsiella variicola subsp. variicola]HCT9971665.1 glycosyltransferase family 92 protein [Klebsiella variicola]
MQNIHKFEPQSVKLPINSDIKRKSKRPNHLKQHDYDEKYDWDTLSYDVFYSEGYVYLSGPPSYGLESLFKKSSFSIDGINLTSKMEVIYMDRAQRVRIPVEHKPERIIWENEAFSKKIDVDNDFNHLFKDKNVIFTLSKNNDLNWIKDWIVFYRDKYSINGVLIYDNSSTVYTLDEMASFLSNENLGVEIVLVSWPFKYGPQGSVKDNLPWDSDFCQHGAMENAKVKYLKHANIVFNVDIDELVFIKNNANFFSKLKRFGIVHIPGIWVSSTPVNNEGIIQKKFNDYIYINKKEIFSPYKWAVSPRDIKFECQWTTHRVISLGTSLRRFLLNTSYQDHYYHYKAINTSWKYNRLNHENMQGDLCKSLDLVKYANIKSTTSLSEKIDFIYIKSKISFRCFLKNMNEVFKYLKFVITKK